MKIIQYNVLCFIVYGFVLMAQQALAFPCFSSYEEKAEKEQVVWAIIHLCMTSCAEGAESPLQAGMIWKEGEMIFKKMARMVSSLLPSEASENYDPHPDTEKTEGDAISSGTDKDNLYTAVPDAGTYRNIYIGHAQRKGTAGGRVQASCNKGEISNAVILKEHGTIYGGMASNDDNSSAESDKISLEANWNTIILKDGGSVTTNSAASSDSGIYGGFAESYTKNSGSAEASNNTIIIEKGARLTEKGRPKDKDGTEYEPSVVLYGAYAKSARSGYVPVAASDNAVTINEGASIEASITGYAGYAEVCTEAGGSCDAAANNNAFAVTNAAVTLDDSFTVGHAVSTSTGKSVASGNTATLVLGENGIVKGQFIVGNALHLVVNPGECRAQGNELTVTGGRFEDGEKYGSTLYTGYSWGWGTVYANENITSLTNVEHNGAVFGGLANTVIFNPAAEAATKAYANGNVTAIKDSAMAYVYGGFAQEGQYAEAQGNTLSVSGGLVRQAFAGMASIKNRGEAGSKREAYASGNTLTLQNVQCTSSVCAGYSNATNNDPSADTSVSTKTATSKENTLIAAGGSSVVAYAGYASSDNVAEVTGCNVYLNFDPENEESLDAATEIKGALYGGLAKGTKAKASGNKGVLSHTYFSNEEGYFTGGKAVSMYNDNGEAVASGNIFTVTGSKLTNAYGGQAVSENSSPATAEGNELTLIGAQVSATLYGGYAESVVDTDIDVSGAVVTRTNRLSLYGGAYYGDICGGYASTSSESSTAVSGSNTIELYALDGVSPSFSRFTVFWGGYAVKGDTEVASTGNTLSFNNVNGMTAGNIGNVQNLAFAYTAATLAANDVVLALSGGQDEDKTTIADGGRISVSVASLKGEGDSDVFNAGDKVCLLKNEKGLVLDGVTITLETATAKTGSGALECKLRIVKTATELYLTSTDTYKPVR